MDPKLSAAVLGGAAIGFLVTHRMIPTAKAALFDKGIYGIDINKTTAEQRAKFRDMRKTGEFTPEFRKLVVPESLGILVGAVYLCAVIAIVLFAGGLSLQQVNAAISGIALMLLLGFVDDVMDVRWRHKLILSAFGTIPLLLSYDGPTSIVLPVQLRPFVAGARTVELGVLYLVYIGLYCVFCTNSINILAGVNGVEVGQSLVIGVAQLIYTLIQLNSPYGLPEDVGGHKIALALLAPFVSCSLALWLFNRYPSQVFVGDSYTYFAGMVLAVAGIMGHSTKTLALFFAPQIINFVLSLPQLLKIVECPRHRVPRWNPKTDKLENSRNYTILNAILVVTGPLHEATLTNVLIGFSVFCCVVAFFIRYSLAALFFEVVQ